MKRLMIVVIGIIAGLAALTGTAVPAMASVGFDPLWSRRPSAIVDGRDG